VSATSSVNSSSKRRKSRMVPSPWLYLK
jgi:hypothetical protein